MFRGLLRPGQGFCKYTVLRKTSGVTEKGRPANGKLIPVGEIMGIRTQANQTDKEQWKQKGHPISHTIVQRGTADVKPADILELEGTNRRYCVRGLRDPAELGHFTVYFVEEREDLQ